MEKYQNVITGGIVTSIIEITQLQSNQIIEPLCKQITYLIISYIKVIYQNRKENKLDEYKDGPLDEMYNHLKMLYLKQLEKHWEHQIEKPNTRSNSQKNWKTQFKRRKKYT